MTIILVAEDEEPLRRLYRIGLGINYKPDGLKFVATGDEAISALEEMLSKGEKPELVITDNKMPGTKTGMDVIDYVKANLPDTKVIMIAGEDYEMTVGETALQKGASAFLPEPVNMKTFLETVGKYAITDK